MQYERSFPFEMRLQDVLELVRSGQSSTPSIAHHCCVSVSTGTGDLHAPRRRGHDTRPERLGDSSCRILNTSERMMPSHGRDGVFQPRIHAEYCRAQGRRDLGG